MLYQKLIRGCSTPYEFLVIFMLRQSSVGLTVQQHKYHSFVVSITGQRKVTLMNIQCRMSLLYIHTHIHTLLFPPLRGFQEQSLFTSITFN